LIDCFDCSIENEILYLIFPRYGRKYATLGSGLTLATGSIVSAVAPNPYAYVLGRLMCGAGFASIHTLAGIYAMEFLPFAKRSLCTCTGPYGWGTILLGLVAYFVRPWRTLAWISTSPLFIICPLLLQVKIIFLTFLSAQLCKYGLTNLKLILDFSLVPESPRFLMKLGKFEEAEAVLNSIAKFNGHHAIDGELLLEIAKREQMGPSNDVGKVTKPSYLDLFRREDLRKKTFCFCLIWFSWALVYFGVYFNIKNVPGNLYLNVVCMGLADTIGFPSTLLILEKYGRKKSVVMTMSLGALFMVMLAVLQIFLEPSSWPDIFLILCTIGKLFLAMARSSVRCFTAESYPTDIRSIGSNIHQQKRYITVVCNLFLIMQAVDFVALHLRWELQFLHKSFSSERVSLQVDYNYD